MRVRHPLNRLQFQAVSFINEEKYAEMALCCYCFDRIFSRKGSDRCEEDSSTEAHRCVLFFEIKQTMKNIISEISGQKIKQCFESTKSFAGFRNIFTEEEIESIKVCHCGKQLMSNIFIVSFRNPSLTIDDRGSQERITHGRGKLKRRQR